jgi:hypothetical protein
MDCFTVMMEHEVTVYGPQSATRDAGGGTVLAWSAARTTGVKCLINVSPANERELFAQQNLAGAVTVATFDTSIQRGDKLTVTAGPTLVGINLHVTGIKMQPGVGALGFETLVHITCERII